MRPASTVQSFATLLGLHNAFRRSAIRLIIDIYVVLAQEHIPVGHQPDPFYLGSLYALIDIDNPGHPFDAGWTSAESRIAAHHRQ